MDPITKIKDDAQNIATLDEAGLADLKARIRSAATDLNKDDASLEEVAAIGELADILDGVVAREGEIREAKEAAIAQRTAAADRIKANAPDESDSTDAGADGNTEVVDENADAGAEPALVASTRPRSGPSRMGTRTETLVSNENAEPSVVLKASGMVPGKVNGEAFTGREDLAEFMASQLQRMPREASHGSVIVASASWKEQFPEERRLDKKNLAANLAKIDAVIHPMNRKKALVASGGIPQPVNVDYTMQTWATSERPFRDGLDQFQADRGGLTFRLPPALSDITATSVWTAATDENPMGATKPVYVVEVQDAVTVLVNAIPTRLQFGNLMGQFDPESIAANTDLAMADAARVAETELLTLLQVACTNTITSAKVLGASRDMLTTIRRIAAYYRYANRIPQTQGLTIVMPEWVKDFMNEDRLLELAHDGQAFDVFKLPENYWDECLATSNIRAIWTLDALAADAGAGTYVSQQLAQPTTGAVAAWPTEVMWNIYVDGSVQHLDSGQLNLGVVRDSTLDATNDYETFVEVFEGLAFRGFAGGALQVVSTTHPTGTSSATATVS